jgi:hypothetical protein
VGAYLRSKIKRENLIYLIFLIYYIYVYQVIDPVLYYQAQEPVFFFDFSFLKSFLYYPGGITDCISSFFTQLFFYPLLGSFIITVLALLISVLTFWLIKLIDNTIQVQVLHTIPAILFIAVHSDYLHNLSISLAFIISLLFFCIYLKLNKLSPLWRLIAFLISALILYFITASNIFIFTLLCAIFEILVNRRYILGLSYILFSFFIPFCLSSFLFIMNEKQTYLYLLPKSNTYNTLVKEYHPPLVLYILYAFYPGLLFFLKIKILFFMKIKNKIYSKLNQKYLFQMKLLFIIALSIIFAWISFNEKEKFYYQIDLYAKNNSWQKILDKVKERGEIDYLLTNFQINRALFHSGRMLSELFLYPQPYGVDGLFLNRNTAEIIPLQYSYFFLELGHMNEALHWAYEAMTMTGELPSVLRILSIVYILKQDYKIAYKYVKKLSSTLVYNNCDKYFLEQLESKKIIRFNPSLTDYKNKMVKRDFIYMSFDNDYSLKKILQDNNSNKMAFEYIIACYLLKGEVAKIIENLQFYYQIEYETMPRYLEEAVILYMMSEKENFNSIRQKKLEINPVKINEFLNLMSILKKFENNKTLAKQEVEKKYRDTYWFYLMYNK